MQTVSVRSVFGRVRPTGKRLEAELLLADVLKCSREAVFAHPERVLSEKQAAVFEEKWERLMEGESVAYIVGWKEFFGLRFKVDHRVLVPRPETEHLVEAILERVKSLANPVVLDVGTGSGAIALAVQSQRPDAKVFASDVSEEALQVARENAENLGFSQVSFFQSDLLKDLPWEEWKIDALVANLPYIGHEEFHFVERSVERFEPALALFGGKDGLDPYRRLFEQINCSKRSPRWVLGEFGSFQRERLEQAIRSAFSNVEVSFHADLAGLDRYFIIEFSHAR
jgi:release factor glutamine methyltransferase